MSEQEIYERFIEWLRSSPVMGLPESDVLLPLIKARYSPEDALFLTNMPFKEKTIQELSDLKQMDPTYLKPRLDALARKGLVVKNFRYGENRYRLSDSFVALFRSVYWSGGRDSEHYAVAPLLNRYFGPFLDQFAHCHTRGLRTLPIEGTIEDNRTILPFEDVLKVLDNQHFFCVGNCSCKAKHNLDPDYESCRHYPFEENCIHFGNLAIFMVENGHGREITREECRDILIKCAEVGLVHGVSNWLQSVDTICNCCKCCCMWLKSYHQFGHGKSLDTSNYTARITNETCQGCGLCVKRCPMEALKLIDSPGSKNKAGKVSVLEPDLCIGCGVCAYKCPTKSIVLERREEITEPPADTNEYSRRFVQDRTNPLPRRQI
jgi:ferredoxin